MKGGNLLMVLLERFMVFDNYRDKTLIKYGLTYWREGGGVLYNLL
jgi:hypothetical protein